MKFSSVASLACIQWILLLPLTTAMAQAAKQNPLALVPDHATISVADLAKERDWYTRVLGFRQIDHIERGPDFAICMMGIPGYRIDLVWQRGSSRSKRAVGDFEQGWRHIVFRTTILDQDYRRLLALQTDVIADRNSNSAITRLLLRDPEGNEVEIFAT